MHPFDIHSHQITVAIEKGVWKVIHGIVDSQDVFHSQQFECGTFPCRPTWHFSTRSEGDDILMGVGIGCVVGRWRIDVGVCQLPAGQIRGRDPGPRSINSAGQAAAAGRAGDQKVVFGRSWQIAIDT
jgi:hypothetical protein